MEGNDGREKFNNENKDYIVEKDNKVWGLNKLVKINWSRYNWNGEFI